MLYMRGICSLVRRASTFATPVPATVGPDVNKAPDEENLILNPTEEAFLNIEKKERLRKFALLLCYHGEKYLGLQINSNGPSIEGELFDAFRKVGYVHETQIKNAGFLLGYSRASRTDSGVSALRQVIAANLPPSFCIERINELLPSDIRVLGKKRTTKSFDAQKNCQARSYCYIMPSYALCHISKIHEEMDKYRIDADTLSLANEIFKVYEGSHRFHNYTEKRDHWDSRSIRRITHCSVSDAFLMGDLEMVELHVAGFSFMLHQIRRMVGMTIAIMRGRFPYHSLKETFECAVMPTPTAPSVGLILEKQYFDVYNERFAHIREPLTWNEYDHEVEKFKLEKIVPRIVEIEREEGTMNEFLNCQLKRHNFKIRHQSSRITSLLNWEKFSPEEIDEMLADESIVNSGSEPE